MPFDPPSVTPAQATQVHSLIHVTPTMAHYTVLMASLSILSELMAIAWYVVVLTSGLSTWLGKLAASKPLFVRGCAYWAAFRGLHWLIFIPFAIYCDYAIPHSYGLTSETLGAWFVDDAKGWVIDTIIGMLMVGATLTLIKRKETTWPCWGAALLIPVIAFGIFATPLVIDPLFNKFTPMAASDPLYAGLHSLASRAGIPNAEIYVVDKSKQTNETNAYVTGLGSSSRIVIWDTLIKKMPPYEVDAVVAHEIGHYVEHHVVIGFVLTSIALFFVLPLLRWASLLIIRRYGRRWSVTDLWQPAAIPVILLAVSLLGIVAFPIENAASRYIEHRADAFGLALSGNRVVFAKAFISLANDNLSDPAPPAWIGLLEDHPTLGDRIDFALYGKPSQLWPIPPRLPRGH